MYEDKTNMACGWEPTYLGTDETWKKRIVAEQGSHYFIPSPLLSTESVSSNRSQSSAWFVLATTVIFLGAFFLRLRMRSRYADCYTFKAAKAKSTHAAGGVPLMQSVFTNASYGISSYFQLSHAAPTTDSSEINSDDNFFPSAVSRSQEN
jgi:hypothetical protein